MSIAINCSGNSGSCIGSNGTFGRWLSAFVSWQDVQDEVKICIYLYMFGPVKPFSN